MQRSAGDERDGTAVPSAPSDADLGQAAGPLFTVVIPVYNKAPHVKRCLDSVLAQTEPRFEIVAVDDASTDGSGDILAGCADPRLTILRRPAPGPGASPARNLAIAHAQAPWLAFLDADDAWQPRHLEMIVRAWHAQGDDIGCVFAQYESVYPDGRREADPFSRLPASRRAGRLDFAAYLEAWLDTGESPMCSSTAAIRTAVMRQAGGFPERGCERGEDKDTWLRIMARTVAAASGYVGAAYHRDSVNMITNRAPECREHCIAPTVRALVAASRNRREIRLLKRINNLETLNLAKSVSRARPLTVSVFRHFYVLASPIWFILICGMWLVPARKGSRLRRWIAAVIKRPKRGGTT